MTNTVRSAEGAPVPGVVFTKRWVVDLMLELIGYDHTERLFDDTIVDPACGDGAFVVAAIERLIASCEMHGVDIATAAEAIRALDIDETAIRRTRRRARELLVSRGTDQKTAGLLSRRWILHGDFLLDTAALPKAKWVVGNPPYVRIEDASRTVMSTYRQRWQTMTGRADTYVGFIEAGLSLLRPEGRLAYICPDRWMRNRYGHKLRALIEDEFAMDVCIAMHEVDAFDERVAAYPAVTVVRRGEQKKVLLAEAKSTFHSAAAARLTKHYRQGSGEALTDVDFRASWRDGWYSGSQSWNPGIERADSSLAAIEERLPTLEAAGVCISVGVATGADDVFIVEKPGAIEPGRLVPVIGAKELLDGRIEARGRWLVNPWTDAGLVDLKAYPGLERYLRSHASRLKGRHVAKAHPDKWWRTIDRVNEEVVTSPKLLIPDVKDQIHPVLDVGQYYPMHNLYYATAPGWDLRVLGGLLMSDIANEFIEAYSVRMANGYFRVSAQYLRRIRVPLYSDIDTQTRRALRDAFAKRDSAAASSAAAIAYGL